MKQPSPEGEIIWERQNDSCYKNSYGARKHTAKTHRCFSFKYLSQQKLSQKLNYYVKINLTTAIPTNNSKMLWKNPYSVHTHSVAIKTTDLANQVCITNTTKIPPHPQKINIQHIHHDVKIGTDRLTPSYYYYSM